MVTMAQRIEALRTEKGLSRPALAAALGLPRLSIEKFETGRQTPSQEQQQGNIPMTKEIGNIIVNRTALLILSPVSNGCQSSHRG